MLEFTLPTLLVAATVGVVTALVAERSPYAFLIGGYAAVALFVVAISFLVLASDLPSGIGGWLGFIIFMGSWSPIVFFVASGMGFAISSVVRKPSHPKE
jgi:hypothetical protein